jgi:rRNA processing protein Gar1
MNRLGVVLHLSGSKKLILQTKTKIKTGVQVFDEGLKPVGIILDVFGPVENPYISIKPSIEQPEQYVGRPLYLISKNRRD